MTGTTYKVSVDEYDHYCEDEKSARTIYVAGVVFGCDCRLWVQTWGDGDEPDEECIASTDA